MKLGYKLAFAAFYASNAVGWFKFSNPLCLHSLTTLTMVLVGGLACDLILEAAKDTK